MTHLFVDSNNTYLILINDIKVVPKKENKNWNFFIILLILSVVSFGTYEFWKFRDQKS